MDDLKSQQLNVGANDRSLGTFLNYGLKNDRVDQIKMLEESQKLWSTLDKLAKEDPNVRTIAYCILTWRLGI